MKKDKFLTFFHAASMYLAVAFLIPQQSHSAYLADLWELSSRPYPANGPLASDAERYSILAPGTGGLLSEVCQLCDQEMYLYDDIVNRDGPLQQEDFLRYYKDARAGLRDNSVKQVDKVKEIFDDDRYQEMKSEFVKRGYPLAFSHTPPNTLVSRIDYDSNGVPHIVGETPEDVSYGLGYASATANYIEMLALRLVGKQGLLNQRNILGMSYSSKELLDTINPKLCADIMGADCEEMATMIVAYEQGVKEGAADHSLALHRLGRHRDSGDGSVW
jgi:hypothetical protein